MFQLNTIDEAVSDLKRGKLIIVCDDFNRENEGDLVGLADTISVESINFMIKFGRGLVCVPVSEEVAKKFSFTPMINENSDKHGTAFTISVDHKNSHTGISAHERFETIKAMLHADTTAEDFRRPGHVFPLISKRHGVLERPGHTEATVDLANIANQNPVGVICEIINDDGTMARRKDLIVFAKKHDLKIISIADLIKYRKQNEILVKREAISPLPTLKGDFTIVGYSNVIDNKEHIALIYGEIGNLANDQYLPVVRMHSECLTGDVLHSLRCDCGEQLDNALNAIIESNLGILLYLRQEGRGIGLLNKLKTYELQNQGLDTFDANVKLGFGSDEREYSVAAQMLKDLGIKKIKLITNNPDKIKELELYGIEVIERISLTTPKHKENEKYLQTKKSKFGHLIK